MYTKRFVYAAIEFIVVGMIAATTPHKCIYSVRLRASLPLPFFPFPLSHRFSVCFVVAVDLFTFALCEYLDTNIQCVTNVYEDVERA